LAEWQGRSGKDLLLSFVLGVEVECRLGEAVNPEHYNRGWHSTSTLGHFGSAVGAAKLLNGDVEKIVHAIGIAGTQSCGLRQVFGTMSKPLHPGKAAMNGLMAAILASKGFTSSREMLGGEKGFTSVLCQQFDSRPLLDQLGQTWKVDEIIFKRHASCYRTHGVIECMLALRQSLLPHLDVIESIDLSVPPLAWDMAGILQPQTGLEGKFSQPFCAAIALLEGKAMDRQFIDEKLLNHKILELIAKSNIVVDEKLSSTEAVVKVTLKDGMAYSDRKDTEKIHPPEGQVLDELQEKFYAMISSMNPEFKGDPLFDLIMNLDRVGNIKELVKSCPSFRHDQIERKRQGSGR
jgi:2-methylcitrate dehydratase PrpD